MRRNNLHQSPPLKDFDRLKSQIVPIFKDRVEYSYERIKNIKFLDCHKPEGGIYLFVNIQKTKMTAEEFRDYLIEKCGIMVVSGDSFGVKGFVRIACTLDIKILKEAFDRIEKLEF